MAWSIMEFKNLDLGEKRNNKRAIKIVNSISKAPKSSLPTSCQGWVETQATDRFYSKSHLMVMC